MAIGEASVAFKRGGRGTIAADLDLFLFFLNTNANKKLSGSFTTMLQGKFNINIIRVTL